MREGEGQASCGSTLGTRIQSGCRSIGTTLTFLAATTSRLGLVTRAPTAACMLPKAVDGEKEKESQERSAPDAVCGAHLKRAEVHAAVCRAGPARMMPHNRLKQVLAASLREARASVDVERHIPELATTSMLQNLLGGS